MKKTILILGLSFATTFTYSQTQQNDKNFDKGVKFFESENYKEAIDCFSKSLSEYPTSNSYFNRAIAYIYTGDSCNFCSDLKSAYRMGHTEAQELYKENCVFSHLNFTIPDSIKIKYPDFNHFEIANDKCTHDSIITAVFVKGNETWTSDISKMDGEVYTIVENMPQYPGGENERNKLLATNIMYPMTATKNGIQGTVYVSFIVETDGSVSNVRILKGIGGGCDEESVRVVKLMPKWIPGKQSGKAVRVLFNMPIYYKLSNNLIPFNRK